MGFRSEEWFSAWTAEGTVQQCQWRTLDEQQREDGLVVVCSFPRKTCLPLASAARCDASFSSFGTACTPGLPSMVAVTGKALVCCRRATPAAATGWKGWSWLSWTAWKSQIICAHCTPRATHASCGFFLLELWLGCGKWSVLSHRSLSSCDGTRGQEGLCFKGSLAQPG